MSKKDWADISLGFVMFMLGMATEAFLENRRKKHQSTRDLDKPT